MRKDRIVAIGFLTEEDLGLLGEGFHRHFPIDQTEDFQDLIARLDRIDTHDEREIVDRTELDIQARFARNANPLAPPINNRAGS